MDPSDDEEDDDSDFEDKKKKNSKKRKSWPPKNAKPRKGPKSSIHKKLDTVIEFFCSVKKSGASIDIPAAIERSFEQLPTDELPKFIAKIEQLSQEKSHDFNQKQIELFAAIDAHDKFEEFKRLRDNVGFLSFDQLASESQGVKARIAASRELLAMLEDADKVIEFNMDKLQLAHDAHSSIRRIIIDVYMKRLQEFKA